MQIYVCIKHVPDSAANITIVDGRTIDRNVPFLLNPYDEHAVTQAAELKKNGEDVQVTALCLGPEDGEKTLRTALAMGADRGILIQSETIHDSMETARILKAAMEQAEPPDMILMGQESIDVEGMQTMFRLGALFDFPVATHVVRMELGRDRVRTTYGVSGDKEQVCDMTLPCVIAAGRGLNTPAYPTFPDVVKARKKPVTVVPLADLSVESSPGRTWIVSLAPLEQARSPRALTGTPEVVCKQLIHILKHEAKVIS